MSLPPHRFAHLIQGFFCLRCSNALFFRLTSHFSARSKHYELSMFSLQWMYNRLRWKTDRLAALAGFRGVGEGESGGRKACF